MYARCTFAESSGYATMTCTAPNNLQDSWIRSITAVAELFTRFSGVWLFVVSGFLRVCCSPVHIVRSSAGRGLSARYVWRPSDTRVPPSFYLICVVSVFRFSVMRSPPYLFPAFFAVTGLTIFSVSADDLRSFCFSFLPSCSQSHTFSPQTLD